MILTTRFTFIVEWSWKNMHFHPKLAWLPATYDVISRNHSNWLSLNLTQNLREGWANSYWKRQVLIFYPLGKISEGLMGWGWHPTSLPLLVRPRVKKSFSRIVGAWYWKSAILSTAPWSYQREDIWPIRAWCQNLVSWNGGIKGMSPGSAALSPSQFSYLTPFFVFHPPSPPLRSPIPGYSPCNIASYLQSLDSAAFPLLQCCLGKLWHNTSRQTSKTPK